MFRVFVSGWLADGDKLVLLQRSIELPFAPFPGLDIDFVGDNSSSLRVEAVRWVAPDGYFYAELNDELFQSTFPGPKNDVEKLGWAVIHSVQR